MEGKAGRKKEGGSWCHNPNKENETKAYYTSYGRALSVLQYVMFKYSQNIHTHTHTHIEL